MPIYQENQLSAREKSAVEKHVKDCPEARKELKQLERLGKALKSIPEPKMPNDLHDKIMTRLHGKPAAVKSFWPRASWGLAAAASLAFIFFVQNFEWPGNKSSEIVLKPASSPPLNQSSQANIALKAQTNRLGMDVSVIKAQGNAVPLAQLQIASVTPPMVLAMASVPQTRKKAMVEKKMNANESFQSETTASAPQAASVPEVNNNGQTETKPGLNNYQILDMEPGQPVEKQVPQFIRLDVLEIGLNKYQVNWQTNLATRSQVYVLDSTGNTLQAIAESTSFTYDHQMTIDDSTINTDFFIKVLATYLNGNQAVTVSNVLKHQ